jgi:hypothetical protein
VKGDSDEFNERYLPARYKEQVRAKQQRRLMKRLLFAGGIVLILGVLILSLSGILSGLMPGTSGPQKPGSPVPTPSPSFTLSPGTTVTASAANVTVVPTPSFTVGSGMSLLAPGSLSLDKAVAALREDYPEADYEIISVNVTNLFAGRNLYEFSVLPGAGTPGRVVTVAYIDAVSGATYAPGQETARVKPDRAQQIATAAFPRLSADQIRIRYTNNPNLGKVWAFTFSRNGVQILSGDLDAETGQISSFERVLHPLERAVNPKIDLNAARAIADQYIVDQNGGPQPVNMSAGRYVALGSTGEPVAGVFRFEYNRIVQDIACENDGFTVSVDSLTGDISAYSRRWNDPESAFAVVEEPLALEHEATFKILQRAMTSYPGSVSGLHIVSAEIRWRDQHPPEIVPRPGSIRTAWKILFTDDILSAKQPPVTAFAWVDTQSGEIIEFSYQH